MSNPKFLKINAWYAAVILLSVKNAWAANFSIVPYGTLPTTVSAGQTVSAYYTVINMTNTARHGYVLQGLPATVVQNTTSPNCGDPINLGPNDSCQLQLVVSGAASSNIAICKGNSCTTATVPLNVTVTSAPQTCGGPNNECRVFLTETTTQGNITAGNTLSGPAATTCSQEQYAGNPFSVANCICTYEAANVWSITGSTFKAWLSTSTVTAPTNIDYNTNLTYVSIMPNGGIIADPGTLLSGSLLSPIAPNASTSIYAYTGTSNTGTPEDPNNPENYTCSNWTTAAQTSGTSDGAAGKPGVASQWSVIENAGCNSAYPIYCFESP